jgi:hypothetical protein
MSLVVDTRYKVNQLMKFSLEMEEADLQGQRLK